MNLSSLKNEEVEQFSHLASRFWDINGPFGILHRMNPLRLALLRMQLEKSHTLPPQQPFEGFDFLDVGCGGGGVCEPLRRLGGNVTGLDPSEEMIKVAQEHAQEARLDITYQVQTLEEYDANTPSTNLFDVISAFDVIEHVDHPDALLKRCFRRLKPGGLVILSTLNRTFLSYTIGIVIPEYILRWIPQGTHNWQQFITPQELEFYLTEAGFQSFEVQGITYRPFTKRWVKTQDHSVNYIAWARRPQ